jgi:penicillin-binding protein 1A
MRKLFVYFLWTLLFIIIFGAATAFYAINEGWIGYMPPIEDLQNPINRFATNLFCRWQIDWNVEL